MSRYPWHDALWSHVSTMSRESRLPHALLLRGGGGLGKRDFAERMTQALLCDAPGPDLDACGMCKSCRLVVAGSHPDLFRVAPAEAGKPITIDTIRSLGAFYALKPHFGSRKLATLVPADALNRNAADALLKTLEEPPGGALLLLVSDQPGRLPATIRSRCQELRFSPPPTEMARTWLKKRLAGDDDPDELLKNAGGAPLRALALSQRDYPGLRDTVLQGIVEIVEGELHPAVAAEGWGSERAVELLMIAASVVQDLARLHAGASAAQLNNARQSRQLAKLRDRIDVQFNFKIHAKILEILNLLVGSYNLRKQDLVEEMAACWVSERA